MASVTVEVHGKRHTVRVSPMAPLTKVVEEALRAEGVDADAGSCKLMLNKKQLDASTPLRFANVPTGAKLQLVTGKEQRTGFGAVSHAAQLSQAPAAVSALQPQPTAAAASTQPPPAASRPQPAALTAQAQAPSTNFAAGLSAAVPQAHPSSCAALASHPPVAHQTAAANAAAPFDGGNGATPPQQAAAAGFGIAADPSGQRQPPQSQPSASNDSPATMQAPASQTATGPPQHAPWSTAPSAAAAAGSGTGLAALLGREAFVFSRAAAQEADAAVSRGPDEPPDDFYDFTADDYARVARGWGANAAGPSSNAPLKTSKLRATEAAAAAERIGPIPIRVMFSDGMILQTSFAALDCVSALQEFVARAAAPGVQGLHVYTAPPKCVLKDKDATLYEAGLAPAAVVYAGATGGEAPQLRPEVLAFQGPSPPKEFQPHGRNQQQQQQLAAAAEGGTGSAEPAEGSVGHPSSNRSASGARLPKWMKVGK